MLPKMGLRAKTAVIHGEKDHLFEMKVVLYLFIYCSIKVLRKKGNPFMKS